MGDFQGDQYVSKYIVITNVSITKDHIETNLQKHMTDKTELTEAVLVGLNIDQDANEFNRSMAEMKSLAKAGGFTVTGTFTQTLERPNTGTYIGSGKIEEIGNYLKMTQIGTVLFDNQLTPVQMRNLSDQLKAEIIDRTGLILEIFSSRARTREARLQVEYARLEYMLPRLAGMHTELGRQGGTSGAMSNRGAGETKIELDRRRIEHRIHEIKKDLNVIENERSVQRKQRLNSTLPKIALVGYTNAGKSTILNQMLTTYGSNEKKVLEKDMLFATLDTSVRKITPGKDRLPFLLSDTVGFISNLPTTLVKAFRSTLEETKYADILLIVSDVSDPDYKENLAVTMQTLADIGAGSIPRIFVFNKADLTDGAHSLATSVRGMRPEDGAITMSAKAGTDIERLIDLIEETINKGRIECDMLIPYNDGGALNAMMQSSQLEILDYTPEGTKIHVFCRKDDFNRYKSYII